MISITSPSEGDQLALFLAVAPMFNCLDTGSGVSSCSGPGTVTTGPVGSHTYTVTAVDNAGNASTLTHTYNVYWPGFAWVSPPASARAGSSVSVRFRLGGSDYGLGILAAGSPTSFQVNCSTGAALGSSSATSGSLSYAGGTYRYSWGSVSSWRNTCRTLVLRLDDNTEHRLTIRFT